LPGVKTSSSNIAASNASGHGQMARQMSPVLDALQAAMGIGTKLHELIGVDVDLLT
jgi:hypothetical protein